MMLANCQNYQTFYSTLRTLFDEHPKIVVTGFDADGNEYPMWVSDYNTWTLVIFGTSHTGHATNIREMLEPARRLVPTKIVSLEYSVEAGGNKYKLRKDMDLSNPEAVTSTFAELFRRILHEQHRKS